MEVKEYSPVYRKAMIDMLRKYDAQQVPYLEICLDREDHIGFVLLDRKKFRGYVAGTVLNPETVCCLLWQSKTSEQGIFLAHEAVKKVKQLGYKTLVFTRDKDHQIYRREL